MVKLFCQNKKCPYNKQGWIYKGKSKLLTTCPKCMYKVNIKKQLRGKK